MALFFLCYCSSLPISQLIHFLSKMFTNCLTVFSICSIIFDACSSVFNLCCSSICNFFTKKYIISLWADNKSIKFGLQSILSSPPLLNIKTISLLESQFFTKILEENRHRQVHLFNNSTIGRCLS